jgi:hypothetical protein
MSALDWERYSPRALEPTWVLDKYLFGAKTKKITSGKSVIIFAS